MTWKLLAWASWWWIRREFSSVVPEHLLATPMLWATPGLPEQMVQGGDSVLPSPQSDSEATESLRTTKTGNAGVIACFGGFERAVKHSDPAWRAGITRLGIK